MGELWGLAVWEQGFDDKDGGKSSDRVRGAGCGGAAEGLLASLRIGEAADDARSRLESLASSKSNVSTTEEVGASCTLLSAMELLCDWREPPAQEGGGRGNANAHLVALVEHLVARGHVEGCITPLNSLFFDFSDEALLSIARAAFRS